MSRETDQETQHEPRKGNITPLDQPESVQAQASAWLAKLDGDEPSTQDLRAFKQWVNENPAHIAAFEKVAAAWDELNILTRLPSLLQQRQLQEHQQAQQERQQQPRPQLMPERQASLSWRYLAVAATLVIGLMVTVQQNLLTPQHAIYATAVGEQKTVTLPDNSVVQLNTNSRIAFDYRDDVRALYLYQGEAHFTVAKNPERPFEVYAGAGLVRAIGTAFSVMLARSSSDINVIVTEGVVEIAPEVTPPAAAALAIKPTANTSANPDGISLAAATQNQRVTAGNAVVFNRSQVQAVQKMAADEMQQRLAWQQGLLIFSGDRLEDVVAEISRYTDTKIIIKSDAANNLRIGGQFKVADTRAIFSALEKGFGLKAEYATNSLVYLSFDASSQARQ